jgi:hypothetical protein
MSAENSREGGILPGYHINGVRFHEAIMKLFSRKASRNNYEDVSSGSAGG